MSISKCDIIRDSANAISNNSCSGANMPVICEVSNMANSKMALFKAKYNPVAIVETGVAKLIRDREVQIYNNQIETSRAKLAAAYPTAPTNATDINWQDHTLCLWDPSGAPGGMLGNEKYITRLDLTSQMAPKYMIGGNTMANKVWKYGMSPMSINTDYIMNPDLAVILIITFIMLVFIGLTVAMLTKKSSGAKHTQNAEPLS